jgi:hypothetical protein
MLAFLQQFVFFVADHQQWCRIILSSYYIDPNRNNIGHTADRAQCGFEFLELSLGSLGSPLGGPRWTSQALPYLGRDDALRLHCHHRLVGNLCEHRGRFCGHRSHPVPVHFLRGL